jgi:hypothetical protein
MSFDWGHWTPPEGYDCVPEDALGFLYKITDKRNGKFYVGIKQVTKKIKRKPLKGKKRNRISIGESDWRKYCSSSGEISEDIKNNESDYQFEILSFHPSKSLLKYAEEEFLVKNNCLFDSKCYNQMFNYRLRFSKN